MITEFERARRKNILKWVKQYSILDMGSNSFGEYKPSLHDFLKMNIIGNVTGLDLENADLIVDLNNKHYPIYNESYDTIIAGEVIEHLNSPFNFLKECKRIMKPDGRLIITTPNMNSITYILGIVKNIDKKHYHSHAWNIDLFDALIDRAGFKIVHKEMFNNLASRDYILDLFTKIFPVFKTNLFYVLEKKKNVKMTCGMRAMISKKI